MIAIYARQSVERENSVSIETQIDFCKAMLKPNERNETVRIYADEGASGGNTDRKDFIEMMTQIRQGKIHKVITYKLDRISRSLSDFVGILQTFREYKVEFVSSQESFDTSSIYGDLILKILIVFAEFERTSIINRVRDAYAKRTDLGLYMGGRRQYGYRLKDTVIKGIRTKEYAPVMEEIEQIKYIFSCYSTEGVSLRGLLQTLLDENLRPVEGKDWSTSKLSTLLKNPVYVKADCNVYRYYEEKGVRIINDDTEFDGTKAAFLYGRTTHDHMRSDWSDMKLVLAQHEGAIDSHIWLSCQRKLERNRQIGNSVSNRTSWLAGKLICAQCGHTMTTIKSPRRDGSFRRYFVCTGKTHQKTCAGISCTIYAEDLERKMDDWIGEKLKQIGTVKKQEGRLNQAEDNQLKLQLSRIEHEQKKLIHLVLEKDVSSELLDILNQKACELIKQKRQVYKKIRKITKQEVQKEEGVSLFERWKTAGYRDKKAVTAILVSHIIMYGDGSLEVVWNI